MSPPPTPRMNMRTSRRTTLGVAVAGVALLAGCDLGDPDPDEPASRPEPSAAPDDPDAGLVEKVAADVASTLLLVESVRHRYTRLRRPLAGLAQVHEAHLQVLGSSRAAGRKPPRSGSATDAMATLRAREQRHQRLLVDRAVAAESGQLARLLASMSAAIAQQLTVLPGERP